MKHMKKILAFLLTFVLCIGVFAGCGANDDSQVVAKVGDEVITAGELKYAIELIKMQLVGQLQSADAQDFWNTLIDGVSPEDYIRKEAIDYLIDRAVMAQAAKDNGIVVTSAEVDEYYNQNKETLASAIEQLRLTEDTLKLILRKEMLYSKYRERMMIPSERFNPSEEILKEYFGANFYKAQHILKVTVDQTTGESLPQAEAEAKKAEIDALLPKVKGGADFKTLMMEQSDDPGKEQAPDGYVFTEGEMVPEFYEGTVALGENEISDVITSSFGYHIIKRLPLDMEADFTENQSTILDNYCMAEEIKLIEELQATMEVTQDDAKINAIPVRDVE